MSYKVYDLERYAACARRAIAEGAVLLKNDSRALPLKNQEKIALFGRSLYNYYKSGTGSGGLVNVTHVTSILEAVEKCEKYQINQALKSSYDSWIAEHPYDAGHGWGTEPWFQEEMPLTEELVLEAAQESETALIVIGRTAGEDQDNKAEAGSYLLTELEEDMLAKVCKAFKKSIVLLNVGNIIDMKWVEKYDPSAVMYVWQGGQEGGNGVLDLLDGTISPSGKLSDTIAYDINDYPSMNNYGDPDKNIYEEDIYVGYRYFETFAPEKVLYPFGFGMSYTTFKIDNHKLHTEHMDTTQKIMVTADILNTGSCSGKEVLQVYVKKPQGTLGQPIRCLCGYAKTSELKPDEQETITITFDWYSLASYDDSGVTGHKSCYVLEAGEYEFYAGNSVRTACRVSSIKIPETIILQQLEESLAPIENAQRLYPMPASTNDNSICYTPAYHPIPLRTISQMDKRNARIPEELAYTGDQGYKLSDVADHNVSMETFIAQLSDEDLCAIIRGEGMGSPKVTPGTGGAFGGVTESLKRFGIPIGCCSDGPSGIRMDCGTKAFSLPNGTLLACTFNDTLNTELFEWEGLELRKNKIDVLLGPGMNIHRCPLNGRNFEYFSEDPLLAGKMGAAQLRGMHKYQVTGTIKHFAGNNQEFRRNYANAVVSERALREIYLKGFEIAVKEAEAYAVMSTYGPINGTYTSSNYDLLTTILRNEWGFKGIVMTDWWAKGNDEGQPGDSANTPQIVRAQNDLYMVNADAETNSNNDRSMEGLQSGIVTRSEFQRCAMNICETLLRMPAFHHFIGKEDKLDNELKNCLSAEDEALANVTVLNIGDAVCEIDPADINTSKGITNFYQVFTKPRGLYKLSITCRAEIDNELAQIPLSIFQDKELIGSINLTGADTEPVTHEFTIVPAFLGSFYFKLFFGQSGMKIEKISFELVEDQEEEIIRIIATNH